MIAEEKVSAGDGTCVGTREVRGINDKFLEKNGSKDLFFF